MAMRVHVLYVVGRGQHDLTFSVTYPCEQLQLSKSAKNTKEQLMIWKNKKNECLSVLSISTLKCPVPIDKHTLVIRA